MAYEFSIVDVFTDVPLAGNQLAVFVDSRVPDDLLQPIAQEIGFSETVFVLPDDRVRIFTPATELPFAGHPVLGTAAVLARGRGQDVVTLLTGRGPVDVAHAGDGRGTMVQPLPSIEPWPGDESALLAALGLEESVVPIEQYDNGVAHLYVAAADREIVRSLRPDVRALGEVAPGTGVNVIAGEDRTWKNRMFFPGAGVAEDAATGSAAGPLAVHVARHGLAPWGEEIEISQGAEIGRPSTLFARATGGPDLPARVEVSGYSVIVGRGAFEL